MIHSLVTIDMTTILSLMYLRLWRQLLVMGSGEHCLDAMNLAGCTVIVTGACSWTGKCGILLDERLTGLQFFGAVLIMTGCISMYLACGGVKR